MSNSWGHAVRKLPADEAQRVARIGYTKCGTRCDKPRTHATSYKYVTGRAGRVSWAERTVCEDHARKFATKHGCEIVEADRPVHALEAALRPAASDLP